MRPEQLWVDEGEQVLDQLEAGTHKQAGDEGSHQSPQKGGLLGLGSGLQQDFILSRDLLLNDCSLRPVWGINNSGWKWFQEAKGPASLGWAGRRKKR